MTEQHVTLAKLGHMSNENKTEREHIHMFLDVSANKQMHAEDTMNELSDMITDTNIVDTVGIASSPW